MRTYNVWLPPPPSPPLLSRVGWGDPVLCQYVNNGSLYYYVCNEIFSHGAGWLQIFHDGLQILLVSFNNILIDIE